MQRRWVSALGLAGVGMAALALQACSGGGGGNQPGEKELGSLSLPLLTQSASGTSYRLRDATFEIYGQLMGGFGGSAGTGGSSPPPIIVSSEDDPDAPSITVSLEQGYYTVRLVPGWRMEKVEAGVATPVEAHLLSSEYQYLWVSPQTTSWVEYEFGIGDRTVWLNGDVNIGVRVYEDPSERYPYGGTGGWMGGTGGSGGFTAGTFAGGAAPVP